MQNHSNFKKLMRLTLIGFAFFSCLINSHFSFADTEEDGRFWFSIYTQGALPKEKWFWSLDIHPRLRDEGSHFDTLILRPALFYKITRKTSIWTGYDTISNHPAGQSLGLIIINQMHIAFVLECNAGHLESHRLLS